MDALIKYPRTRHIEGSGLQRGDHDLERVPFAELVGRILVVEEKLDGANVGISFASNGELRLQCRGHFLTGGPGEKQFSLLKTWAQCHRDWLFDVLTDRYVLYAEWLFAKHTVFYDALPHYLMEFDILDTQTGDFLSTERRHAMLAGYPIVSVPVLKRGSFKQEKELTKLVTRSLYKTTAWRESLGAAAQAAGSDPAFVLERETDNSDLSEGLYIKWEEAGRVRGRYKWVRPEFVSAILDSGSHWKSRPLIANGLRQGADLFSP